MLPRHRQRDSTPRGGAAQPRGGCGDPGERLGRPGRILCPLSSQRFSDLRNVVDMRVLGTFSSRRTRNFNLSAAAGSSLFCILFSSFCFSSENEEVLKNEEVMCEGEEGSE